MLVDSLAVALLVGEPTLGVRTEGLVQLGGEVFVDGVVRGAVVGGVVAPSTSATERARPPSTNKIKPTTASSSLASRVGSREGSWAVGA